MGKNNRLSNAIDALASAVQNGELLAATGGADLLLAAAYELGILRARVAELEAALRDIYTGESHILAACDGCGGVCHVDRAGQALGAGGE